MKVLYVGRSVQSDSLKDFIKNVKTNTLFLDQEGFFEQALYSVAEVTQVPLSETKKTLLLEEYDACIINWKQTGYQDMQERIQSVLDAIAETSVTTGIFVGAAQAEYLPPEKILNEFDLIFKREPILNRSRYQLSSVNLKKIIPTMISCPLKIATKPTVLGRLHSKCVKPVATCSKAEEVCEVGFSGADAADHTLRRGVWGRVVNEGFVTIGGLQPNPYTKKSIPVELQGKRFVGKEYRNSLCAAKINLALDGIGEYTFRHQELLYLGKFMLCSPSIRNIELPMPLRENVHYVAFDDLDDMVEKIRFYLEHEDERLKIAKAGKKLFDEYYDPVHHGQAIIAALQRVQQASL